MHRSEEHTSELQSPCNLVCRLLLEKKKTNNKHAAHATHPHHCTSHRQHPHPAPARAARQSVVVRIRPALSGGPPPVFFFFNDTATTEIYTLSLHDALPI